MSFEIGTIVNTHGVKGEVRVMPSTFDKTRFERIDEISVESRAVGVRVMRIENVWYHKQFVVLKLAGVDDMNAAAALKTAVIRIPDEQALPLADDEYYQRDLYGMRVISVDGDDLGELTGIIETGANDVYVVKSASGELLIPAIKQCILDVDVADKQMRVRLLEGLR